MGGKRGRGSKRKHGKETYDINDINDETEDRNREGGGRDRESEREKTRKKRLREREREIYIYICCKVKNWSKIWGFIS